MGMYNKSQFVFSETFNNKDGKTSGSGFIGVLIGLASVIAFLASIVGWFMEKPLTIEFMQQVLQFAGISGLLLGVRKVSSFFGKKEPEVETPKPEKPKPDPKPVEVG